MNNEVKIPEESDFPKMHLVVLDSNDNHVESPYHYQRSSSEDEITIKIKFVNPYSVQEFPDNLQFVMEVAEKEESETVAAEFVDGGAIGCDGNVRVSAREDDNDGIVVLKVKEPATTKLRVWSGWATGQNSVRLTPDLILEPGPGPGPGQQRHDESESKKEAEEQQQQQQKLKSKLNSDIESDNNSDNNSDSKTSTEKIEKRIEEEYAKDETRPDGRSKISEEDESSNKNAGKMRKKNLLESPSVPKGLEDMVENNENEYRNGDINRRYKQEIIRRDKIPTTSGEAKTIKQKINDKHADLIQLKKEDFNGGRNENDDDDNNDDDNDTSKTYKSNNVLPSRILQAKMKRNFKNGFDISRHFYASAFFALSMLLIVTTFGKRRGDKGRRDL